MHREINGYFLVAKIGNLFVQPPDLSTSKQFLLVFFLQISLLLSIFWTKPWSQVSPRLPFPPPRRAFLVIAQRVGSGIPSARQFSSNFANPRSRTFREPIAAQKTGPYESDIYTSMYALGGARTREIDLGSYEVNAFPTRNPFLGTNHLELE